MGFAVIQVYRKALLFIVKYLVYRLIARFLLTVRLQTPTAIVCLKPGRLSSGLSLSFLHTDY